MRVLLALVRDIHYESNDENSYVGTQVSFLIYDFMKYSRMNRVMRWMDLVIDFIEMKIVNNLKDHLTGGIG